MANQSAFQTKTELRLNAIPLKPYDIHCIHLAYSILSKDPPPLMNIESLAIEVGINRNKLHYGFKQVYGLTIHEFQTQLCMSKAKLLLATTHKPIKAIASLLGYSNSGDFSYAFKKRFNITPLKYRKESNKYYWNVDTLNRNAVEQPK